MIDWFVTSFHFLKKRLSTIYLKYHEMKKGIIFNAIQNVQNFSKPFSIQIKPLWKVTCIASRHARWAKQWPAKNNLGMSKNRSLRWIKILSEEAVIFLCTFDFTAYLQVDIFQKVPLDCHFFVWQYRYIEKSFKFFDKVKNKRDILKIVNLFESQIRISSFLKHQAIFQDLPPF